MSDTPESDNRKSSLTFAEALTVGFFRYVEEKYPQSADKQTPDEDIPLLATEKNSQGRLVNPSRFLARRAEILLPQRTPVTRKGLEHYASRFLHWMPVLIIVCGLAIFPLGKVGSILSGKEVNLAGGFFWFLCTQLFFLACSFFFLSLFLIRSLWSFLFCRRVGRGPNSQGFLSKISSLTGYVVFRLPDWWDAVGNSFHRMFGRGNRLKTHRNTAEVPEKFGSTYLDFLDYLCSHKAATYFLTGFYSHLFWLCTSLGILLLLFVQMWSNEYKYSCRTSLGDVDHVRAIVRFFGYPFHRVLTLPDDRDIEWLFEQQTSLPANLDAESKVSRTRVHWSHFLLATFFTWAVFPRFCMVLVYGLALNGSLRTFQPRFKDGYYTRIIERQEVIPRQIVRQQVFDDDETPGDENSYRAGPNGAVRVPGSSSSGQAAVAGDTVELATNVPTTAQACVNGDVPPENTCPQRTDRAENHAANHAESRSENGLISASADVPEPNRSIKSLPSSGAVSSIESLPTVTSLPSNKLLTVVFGFESQMTQEQWQTLLPREKELVCFDDVAQSPQSKNDFATWIEQNQKRLARCVMLTDCSCPPARQLTLYLQKRVFPFVSNIDFVVILSRGERLREKYRNNPSAVGQRLQDWNNQLEGLAAKAKVPLTLISYYDHELDLAQARNRLTTELAGSEAMKETDGTRIIQAARLVMSDVKELFALGTTETKSDAKSDMKSDAKSGAKSGAKLGAIPAPASTQASSDDEVLSLLSRFYENLTTIYREESDSFLKEATSSLPSGFGIDFVRQRAGQWLGTLGHAVEGIDRESIQERLVPATAVMNRMRQLCSCLSPRCALCAASIAAALPIAAALAPLTAGTLSVASVAAVAAQLGTLLPTVAASGAAGGAVGAILPLSFGKVRDKFKQGLTRLFTGASDSQTELSQAELSQAGTLQTQSSDLRTIASSVQLYLSASMTWIAVFEFQGMEQSQIAETLNDVLSPLEDSFVLDVKEAKVRVQQVIDRIAPLKQLSGIVL